MFKREEISPERKQELFLKIRSIIAKQLEINENAITLASKITDDLGADSLDAIEIIMELEEEFNIEIPDEDIDKISTIEDIVLYLSGRVK